MQNSVRCVCVCVCVLVGQRGSPWFPGIAFGAIFLFIFLLRLFNTCLASDAAKSGPEREFKHLVIHLRKIIKSDQVRSIHQGFKFSSCGIIICKSCSKESIKKPKLSSQSPRTAVCGHGSLLCYTHGLQMLVQLVQVRIADPVL